MEEIFSRAECIGIPTRSSHHKLKLPKRKKSQGQRALSYLGPSLWNNLDNSLKKSVSLNAFKHNLKDYYFRTGNEKEKSVLN